MICLNLTFIIAVLCSKKFVNFFAGRKKGASFKLSGVSINASSVLKHKEDLEPLVQCNGAGIFHWSD